MIDHGDPYPALKLASQSGGRRHPSRSDPRHRDREERGERRARSRAAMRRHGWRDRVAIACELAGTLALVVGVLLGYATRSVFNSDAFAKRVADSLTEPAVSAFVAGKIADGVIAAKPDLTGLRPIIIAGGRSVVSSAAFRAAAKRAALEAHRAIMSGTTE